MTHTHTTGMHAYTDTRIKTTTLKQVRKGPHKEINKRPHAYTHTHTHIHREAHPRTRTHRKKAINHCKAGKFWYNVGPVYVYVCDSERSCPTLSLSPLITGTAGGVHSTPHIHQLWKSERRLRTWVV